MIQLIIYEGRIRKTPRLPRRAHLLVSPRHMTPLHKVKLRAARFECWGSFGISIRVKSKPWGSTRYIFSAI